MKLLSYFRKFTPAALVSFYHYLWAIGSSVFYGFPAKKMVVIGITGTKGKTTAANFIWACLTAAGFKTGLVGTANIRIGESEQLNPYHMTMPGRYHLQKLLAAMVKAGCTHCVVETTSQGILQSRHLGINYDIAVFTNLSAEHLQAHGGSYERYKKTKGRLFAGLKTSAKKNLFGKLVEKVLIVNRDDSNWEYFYNFWAQKKLTYGFDGASDFTAEKIFEQPDGVNFSLQGADYKIHMVGKFNVANALPAMALCSLWGVSASAIQNGLDNLRVVPGRMEEIKAGQVFRVFVDYAHEKLSMNSLLDAAVKLKPGGGGKIILLLGAEGGGRDRTKRPEMGRIAAQKSDYVIVSNVDPYNDDPQQILEDIAEASEQGGKIRGKDLFVIADRREGIAKAIALAGSRDVVLITGKGSEQSIIIGGKSSPWDDRVVVAEELRKLSRQLPK